jgi:predicted RNA-binding Zn-ribbon protein involved in translation (DUF1610 family)
MVRTVLEGIVTVLALGLFIAFVFLPSILAYRRTHPKRDTIFIVNFLLGPVGIGWIVGMVLLFAPGSGAGLTAPIGDDVHPCPACGFAYRPSDYRPDATRISCSKCGGELPLTPSI